MEKKLKQSGVNKELLTKVLLTMKLIVFIVCLSALSVLASGTYSQNARISLDLKNLSIKDVLREIENSSEYYFLYNNELVDVEEKVDIRVEKETVNNIIGELFKNQKVNFIITGRQIIISPKDLNSTSGVETKISGNVTDNKGEPLPGVTVLVKGTNNGTITDFSGNFSLSNVPDDGTLLFSFVGMRSQEIPVAGKTIFNVTLEEETIGIEDVVVTALGIKKEEKSLGYSVQKINEEQLTEVKSSSITSSLTGKVSGLLVQNTTEFFKTSNVLLRGSEALIVVNGVPATNVSLDDFAPDDIAEISILKGATAAALYGNRGANGAIMITTKKGTNSEQFKVQINSSTIFSVGYLKVPESQSAYGTGVGNQPLYNGQFVWGPRLNMGQTAMQVDPESGKMVDLPLITRNANNLKSFLRESMVTNNNVNIVKSGEIGSIRASLSHVYNRGQAPNNRSNKYIFNLSGNIKLSDKFVLDASWMYSKRETPNEPTYGYGRGGSYIYQLIVWNGPDLDVRQWRNYWKIKDVEQKYYQTGWYNNPYYIAYESVRPRSIDVNNGSFSANYTITPNLKAVLRSGINTYNNRYSFRQAMSYNRNGKGYFETGQNYYMDLNNDLLLTYNKKVGSLEIEALGGGSVNYYQYRDINAHTNNGISIPGYYSLNASNNPVSATSTFQKKQVNSLFGKLSLSYHKAIYLDVTGRNDWSSTLPESTRSYFYPSAAVSTILSEIIDMPELINFWKLRASWTVSKRDLNIFDLNQTYKVEVNAWDGNNTQTYPDIIRDQNVKPETDRVYEFGTDFRMLKNRLSLDYTYFNRLEYNLLISTPISDASGFDYKQTNIDESWVQRGMEITLKGNPIKQKNLNWDILLNWSYNHWYYKELDPQYSEKKIFITEGARYDIVRTRDWERDQEGNIVHGANGLPKESDFFTENIGNSDPDWFWGLTNTVNYKNWSFFMTIDGRFGGLEHSNTEYGLWAAGSHPDSDNQWRYDEVVNGKTNFVGEGVKIMSGSLVRDGSGKVTQDTRVFASNDIPVAYTEYMKAYSGYGSNSPQVRSREFYFDETFVKLRELAVSYKLPHSFIKKLGLSDATIGIVGNNLLMWTKEFRFDDPDGGSGDLPSPSQRYIGYNLKLNF